MDDLRKTNIKGKEYVDVSERVRAYWKLYPKGRIETEMMFFDHEKGYCLFKSTVYDNDGNPKGNGHAHEYQADKTSMVNRTSYVENCETSAIGRAMAEAGILIEYGMASKQEIDAAKKKAKQMDKMEEEKASSFKVNSGATENLKDSKPSVPNAENLIADLKQGIEEEKEAMSDGDRRKMELSKIITDLNAQCIEANSIPELNEINKKHRELKLQYQDKEFPQQLHSTFVGTLKKAYKNFTTA